ncbi:MAG: TonB-dependent receptor [Chitinophagaceae bacterium]
MKFTTNLLLLCTIVLANYSSPIYGQNPIGTSTLKGSVVSETGQPLRGAEVAVEDVANHRLGNAVTDSSGYFEIAGLKTGSTYNLKSYYVGYDTGRVDGVVLDDLLKPVKIPMRPNASKTLDEVVVVGYGTQKKVNLTGAVDQITSKAFEGRVLSNVAQMLQGVSPNLNIAPADGKPTRSPSFNIRGTTSIGQGGSALVIVDGVQGDPSTLNPNDIESVSVLKDAAASAIYGSQGTFGVVLITTKSAKKGKVSFTYSGSFSSQKPTTLPDFVSDGYVYASHFYEAYNAWNNYSSVPARLNKTQTFTLAWLDEFKKRKEEGNAEEVDVDANGNYVYYGNENYLKDLLKKSFLVQDHNLSVSGNDGKLDYYISGRHYDYGGLFRYNTDHYAGNYLRAKGGMQVTSWLKITNNMDYSEIKYHNPTTAGEGGNIWRNIADEGHTSAPIYNPDGTFTFPAAYTVGDFIYGKSGEDSRQRNLRNTLGFESRFLNNALRIHGDFTFRNLDYASLRKRVPVPYSVKEGEVLSLATSFNDNMYSVSQTTRYIFTNLYGEYEKNLNTDHYLKAMVGYNYERQTYSSEYITKTGLLTPDVDNINLALGSATTATGGFNRYRLGGVFFRFNYAFREKYLLEVNGRYDGSSKFPTDQQWAFFPSVSVGWRISKEKFFNVSKNVISDLKLRASYGSLGNGNIDPYTYLEQFSIGTSSRVLDGGKNPYTSAPGVIPDNLTWETARTGNIGLDLTVLNGALTFTGDLYFRKTLNMYTVGPTLPDVFGTDSPKGNYADLTTRGFEISLGYNNSFMLASKPFNYSFKATLADYTARIDRYNNQTGVLTDYYAGQKLGEIWGYVTQGLFQSQAEIDAAPTQTLIKSSSSGLIYPGDIRYADLDGNNAIDYGSNTVSDHGDKKIIGNTTPRYTYSFTTNFDWNRFSLSAFFQGVGKQDWYPSNEAIFWGQFNRPYNNLPSWHLNNYWTEDNPNAYFPRYAGYNASLKTVQTRYLQNVAYIRLKNLQLGYSLPESVLQRLHVKSLRVSVIGENLWTWSPLYKRTKDIDVVNIGVSDPDFGSGYGDGMNYPTLKSYSFNILLNF